jgi:hypothetical protein
VRIPFEVELTHGKKRLKVKAAIHGETDRGTRVRIQKTLSHLEEEGQKDTARRTQKTPK